jgi:hypothetical protein
MGKTEQSPSKRVRIVLCTGVIVALGVAAPTAGAAEWTSKAKPSAEWTSAEWTSKVKPTAEWTSAEWTSKVKPTAEWTSKLKPKAEWTSRTRANKTL